MKVSSCFAMILKAMKWFMKWIKWTADMKSSEAMIFAVTNAIFTIAQRSLKNSGLQRGLNPWPRDSGATLQLSYEATDVGSWSFVGSNVPWRNESMMKWYMKWIIWTADMKSSEAMIFASYERNFYNCVENRVVTGSNPVEVLNFSGFSAQL